MGQRPTRGVKRVREGQRVGIARVRQRPPRDVGQGVLNHAHRNRRAIGAPAERVPAQLTAIRPVGEALRQRQHECSAGPPQQGRARGRGLPREIEAEQPAIVQVEHLPRKVRDDVRRQPDFPIVNAPIRAAQIARGTFSRSPTTRS